MNSDKSLLAFNGDREMDFAGETEEHERTHEAVEAAMSRSSSSSSLSMSYKIKYTSRKTSCVRGVILAGRKTRPNEARDDTAANRVVNSFRRLVCAGVIT